MPEIAIVGDTLMPLENLDPAYLDRGTFYGDGVYDVVRSYAGRLFMLDEHLDRFRRNLDEVRIRGIDIPTVRTRILKAFETAELSDCAIYFHATRGSAIRSHVPIGDLKPNFLLTVTRLPDRSADKQRGVAVCTHPDTRWKRCDIKSLNLLPNVLAKIDAHEKGCAEAIFVSPDGWITEGASSAFFAVFGRSIVSHPLDTDILPSITRLVVVRLAEKLGLPFEERLLRSDEAATADELFIGSSTADLIPVTRFDGKQIGTGEPGELTRRLMHGFADETRNW